jgi:hypothetical protein
MIPVLLRIGPLTVYSYGLMMALGFIAGDYLLTRECRRRAISPDYANALVLWGALAGIAGSRVYAVLDDLPAYLANPAAIIFSGSGFVFYGGLIGGIISTWIVARRYGVPFARTTDLCVPALALGQAFGRLGCQVSGDGDWGLPSTMPWAMAYPRAIVGWDKYTVLKLDAHYNLISGYFPADFRSGGVLHPLRDSARRAPPAASRRPYHRLVPVIGRDRAVGRRVLADQPARPVVVQRGSVDFSRHDRCRCANLDTRR